MSPASKSKQAKSSSRQKKVPYVMLVSGGKGHTAVRLYAAAIAQFPEQKVKVLERFDVRTARRAKAVVSEAARLGAVMMHTFVDPEIRQVIDSRAGELGIPQVDMLGPTLSALGDHLQSDPCGRAGLLYELNREQIDRQDAVDFTLAHDDGLGPSDLDQADIVLVGASRTSKSVACFYLAMRGVRAANVPLIPGCPVPEELTNLDPDRVIGLTMNAAHLASLRRTRMDGMSHLGIDGYAEAANIKDELITVRRLMNTHGWSCIDVSYKATEELTEQIIGMIPKRRTI